MVLALSHSSLHAMLSFALPLVAILMLLNISPCEKLPGRVRRVSIIVLIGLITLAGIRELSNPAMTVVWAQIKPQKGLAGTWQGTLHAGSDNRLVVKISPNGTGFDATLYTIDQGGAPIPIKTVEKKGSTVRFDVPVLGGSYEGKVNPSETTITGNFIQGSRTPLLLTRATPTTEWSIPAPPPPIPTMDPNVAPSFEVATIKPTKPDEQRRVLTIRGRHFIMINQPLTQMISFAYGVQSKQLIGLPGWAESDKFDVDAVPNTSGMPNDTQLKGMLQKLLASRFQFKFHQDQKELSVFVLAVANGGPKLGKSQGDANGLPGLFFRQLGHLNVKNANLNDFAQLMQSVVLDRPVLNQTGLTGRFDFQLNWSPDDSQFRGLGAKQPPSNDGSNSLPNLYTALQEQVGLKMDARKAPAPVLVVDGVQKPSAN